ncbi:ATP-binding cassette domain-containing protein [Methylobacterium aquaticum]|nr:ATP-binding cassette domain-containing protein [Methylobacterium aquaticum]
MLRALLHRRRTPLFLQMEATECGAASLAMVLAAHGRWITLEEARERCGTSRDGVDAHGLIEAARSYGLVALAFRREPADLAALPMPQILHWCFNHFVVLEAVSGGRYHIVDPAQGRRAVEASEFGECFTGLTLAMEPGDEFATGGRPPSAFATLVGEALHSRDALVVSLVTGILAVIPGLALTGAVSTLINHVLAAHQAAWAPALVLVFLGVALAQAGISFLSAWTVAGWKIKIGAVSALRGFAHALTLPLAYYAQRSAGEVVSRIRIGSDLGGTIAGPLANMIPQVVLVVAYLAVISLYDPVIMLAAVAAAGTSLAVLTLVARRLADRTREHQLAEGRAAGIGTAGMANLSTYVMLGREDLLLSRWTAAEDAAIATEQRLGLLRIVSSLGPVASGLVLTGVVLVVCAVRAIDGTLSLGDLVATQMLAGLLNKPLNALTAGLCTVQEAAGALMRLSDLEDHGCAAAFDGRERGPVSDGDGRLTLQGVGYAHSPGRPLLSGMDLALAPGRLVAIVGPSGAGKSTLARLMAGLVDPSEGVVALDGVPLADWPHRVLRRRLVYVGQAPSSFTGSIADNVQLWDPSIPPETVLRSVARTGLTEAVTKRPGGLLTRIVGGETGLSGGEMQRLALARAIARDPAVIVLDETTSALDPAAEEEVLEMLRASGAAIVIVTHRAGTALRCDEAILVGGGGIAERGPPSRFFAAPATQPPAGLPALPAAGCPAPAPLLDVA